MKKGSKKIKKYMETNILNLNFFVLWMTESLLANGAYLTDVRDSAGHSDIETTMHYTHNYTEGKKEIADKVDEIYTPLLNFKIS